MIKLSHSSVCAFNRCRQYWNYKYVKKVPVPFEKSPDLHFGNTFHAALAAYFRGERDLDKLTEVAFAERPPSYLKNDIRLMLEMYLKHWAEYDAEWKIVTVEDKFRLKVDDDWELTVVFDAVMQHPDGRNWLFEHKTTRTADITSAGMWYTRKQTDMQTRIYAYAARELGFPIDVVCLDVIRRPNYKRKDASVEVPKNMDAFFQRHCFEYKENDLDGCIGDLRKVQELMKFCQKSGNFDRNGQACQDFGRQCEFYEECWGE